MWLGFELVHGFKAGIGGGRVLATEAVPRRVVGDERGLVELHRDAEEEREVVLDQGVLVLAQSLVLALAVVLRNQGLRAVRRSRGSACFDFHHCSWKAALIIGS